MREQVGHALEQFFGRQRPVVLGAAGELGPALAAIEEMTAAGKRLRPAFCYWGWRGAGGGSDPGIFTAAGALELLHASALVHDDVMDGSDTRRGRPSMHRLFAARHSADGWRGSPESFGRGAAILIGDLLLSWTDEMFYGSGLGTGALRRGAEVLSLMRTEVLAGQYLDLVEQARASGTVEAALRVARLKTARYTIERPLQLGAALAAGEADDSGITAAACATSAAGAPTPDRDAGPWDAGPWDAGPWDAGPWDAAARLRDASTVAGEGAAGPGNAATVISAAYSRYGLPLGTAFQLRDDLLGVFGDPAQTGKPAGDDLREGKRTVLVAIALAKAGPAGAAVLNRHLGDPLLTAEGVDEVRSVIADVGALDECEALIERYTSEALAALDDAPVTAEARAALAELAVAATTRTG